jgi:uncharacterized protein
VASLKDQLNADLKTAMLAKDSMAVDVLKGLKTAIQYEEVAKQKREEGLSDTEIEQVFVREAKKRDESAVLFDQGGNLDAAEKERAEKKVIEKYLPTQLSAEELNRIVAATLEELGDNAQMGPTIGAVKAKVGTSADGARVAAAVRKHLQ